MGLACCGLAHACGSEHDDMRLFTGPFLPRGLFFLFCDVPAQCFLLGRCQLPMRHARAVRSRPPRSLGMYACCRVEVLGWPVMLCDCGLECRGCVVSAVGPSNGKNVLKCQYSLHLPLIRDKLKSASEAPDSNLAGDACWSQTFLIGNYTSLPHKAGRFDLTHHQLDDFNPLRTIMQI